MIVSQYTTLPRSSLSPYPFIRVYLQTVKQILLIRMRSFEESIQSFVPYTQKNSSGVIIFSSFDIRRSKKGVEEYTVRHWTSFSIWECSLHQRGNLLQSNVRQ